jgi:hypothetical protein
MFLTIMHRLSLIERAQEMRISDHAGQRCIGSDVISWGWRQVSLVAVARHGAWLP